MAAATCLLDYCADFTTRSQELFLAPKVLSQLAARRGLTVAKLFHSGPRGENARKEAHRQLGEIQVCIALRCTLSHCCATTA